MATVTQLKPRPRTYTAELTQLTTDFGLTIKIAGTLDGYIDLCITTPNGKHLTYPLSQADAKHAIAGLHTTLNDITTNCLYDRDDLLAP